MNLQGPPVGGPLRAITQVYVEHYVNLFLSRVPEEAPVLGTAEMGSLEGLQAERGSLLGPSHKILRSLRIVKRQARETANIGEERGGFQERVWLNLRERSGSPCIYRMGSRKCAE